MIISPLVPNSFRQHPPTPPLCLAHQRKPSLANSYISKVITGTRGSRSNKDELKEYEAEEPEPADSDPNDVFVYWCSKARRWTNLSLMARHILSIPGTSAANERELSSGKGVFGISRMSLNPETVEALICLRSWYRAGLVKLEDVHEFVE